MESGLENQLFTKEQAIRDIEELKKRTFSVVISCDTPEEQEKVKNILGIKTKNLKRLYKASELGE